MPEIISDRTRIQDSHGQGRFIEVDDGWDPDADDKRDSGSKRDSSNESKQDSPRKKDSSPNYRDSPQARDSPNYRDSRRADYQDSPNYRDRDRNNYRDSPNYRDRTNYQDSRRGSDTLREEGRGSKPRQPRGKPAMPGTVPSQRDMVPYIPGLPIYGTPDEPASPTDCNRWPNSPYCLAQPNPDRDFDRPVGMPKPPMPFGIDVDIVNDNCNIGIALTPVIAFIPMPTHQIVARSNAPECQIPPPQKPPELEQFTDLPPDWEADYGTPGQLYKLEYQATLNYSTEYLDCGSNATGTLERTLVQGRTILNVMAPIRVKISHGTLDSTRAIYAKCTKIADSGKKVFLRKSLQIWLGGTYLEFSGGAIISSKYWSSNVIDPTNPIYPVYPSRHKSTDGIELTVFNLNEMPQEPPPRYYQRRYPEEPPYTPPPPPEPPKKPEECEPCMCCGNDDSLAMMAMLQQQLNAIQQQLAGLAGQGQGSPDPNNTSCQFTGFAPVLNQLAIIDGKLNLTAKKSDFQPVVEKLPLLADKQDIIDIKEKLDDLDVDVDLTPVLEKLENIDEDIATLSSNLGEFPGQFDNFQDGFFQFSNHAELMHQIYEALWKKQSNLSAIIGEPIEIELYDDELGQVGAQPRTVSPQTLFDAISLSTVRGEIALKGIGVEQYPIKYKAGGEDKEINNLSALTWAVAKAIPVDIFPRVVKWKDKDGKEYELKFENLSDIIFKLIGIPKEVILFDENTEKEGKQPKLLMPMSLFEIIALNFSRTEILAEVIGVDMFPISLKPKWEGGLPGLDDKMTMDEMLELVVSGLSVLDPVSWIIDFQETFAQVPSFMTNFLKAYFNYSVPIIPFIDMIKDFVTKEEENQLHNLVELVNFTRELVIEANDDDGFPIVVEKEQIGGTEDLLFHTQADAIEEIITLLCNLLTTNGYQTDIGLKCLAESVHAKAIGAMTLGETRNIADFLDYPTKAVVQKLKIHINCPAKELADGDVDLDGAEDLDKFLAESEIDITYDEWTGKKSLMDMMRDLLNQAASARGDATRRIGG